MYKTLQKIPAIPSEILHHFIIPHIPFAGLTSKLLMIQKKKICLINLIRNVLYIDNRRLFHDIRKNYNGGRVYTFEGNHLFLYIEVTKSGYHIVDYFSISF
jgi:hypothetical protein